MHEDERYFIDSETYGTKYYGVINNDYVTKCVQLKPYADRVLEETRQYLNIK